MELILPLTHSLKKDIDWLVLNGIAKDRVSVVRKAIEHFVEYQAIQDVLEAEKELDDGKVLTGDLDELAKMFD